MIIDVKYGGDRPYSVIVVGDKRSGVYRGFRPFFYVLAPRRGESIILEKVERYCKQIIETCARRYKNQAMLDEFAEYPKIVETDMTAIVYDERARRYVRTSSYRVYKVVLPAPEMVRSTADAVMSSGDDVRMSAFNIKYPCRVVMSNYWLRPLNIEPIYFGLDIGILDKLSRLRYLVYDIEVLEDGTKIVSLYETDPISEMDWDRIEREIATYIVKPNGEGDVNAIVEMFNKARLLVGFNNVGYDNKILISSGIVPEKIFKTRSSIDLSIFIRNNASALGIGTASFSLAMILLALRKDLNIPDRHIWMKLTSARMLKNLDTAITYNRSDVATTTALSKPLLQMIFGVSGMVQISPSSFAHDLRSGQVSEYSLVKFLEYLGEVIEARHFTTTATISGEELRGSKVFTIRDVERWLIAYADELERLRKLYEKTGDINLIVRELWKLADRILKQLKRTERSAGSEQERELVDRLYIGKIVWVDVGMMYPTEIVVEGIDPCTYYGGVAEDAVFRPDLFPAPFNTMVANLRAARGWAKKKAKEYKEKGDKYMASCFNLLQQLLKPILNGYYGIMTKKSGPAHGAHNQVGLKIFQNSRRKLITMMLYTLIRGWRTLYADTDSLMIGIGENDDPEKVYKEINTIANMVGYELSLEGVMDYIYIRAKKSYMIGKRGETVKVKGQILGKMKHLFSPVIISGILEMARTLTGDKIVELLDSIDDPYLLIPSLARKVTDMFLLDVEALKRRSIDMSRKIRVKLGSVIGILKEFQGDFVTCGRLTALALKYGVKHGEHYIVKLGRIDPNDILDLRCLAVTRLESGNQRGKYSLKGESFIALVGDRLIQARPDLSDSYILVEYGGKLLELPLKYGNYITYLKRVLKIRLLDKPFNLVGMKIRLNIYKTDVDVLEVKQVILRNLLNWLKWSGLDRVINSEALRRRLNMLTTSAIY